MSDTTIEMTAPYRSCEEHQDESWLEDCLHCQIESLQAKIAQRDKVLDRVRKLKPHFMPGGVFSYFFTVDVDKALENSTDE